MLGKKIGRSKNYRSYGLVEIWAECEKLPRFSKLGLLWQRYLQAWRSLFGAPLSAVLTGATIAGSLALFSMLLLALDNLRFALHSTNQAMTVSVYLREDQEQESVKKLLSSILARPEVEQAALIDKKQALNQFRHSLSEYPYLFEGLEENNPLPASIEVQFRPDKISERFYKQFINEIQKLPEVERALYNEGSVAQLSGMLKLLRNAGICAVGFMLLVTGFIIANTIKLSLAAHRHEIEIMRLVGATTSFIQAPYAIEGFIQGVLGSGIAIGLVYLIYLLLEDTINSSALLRLFLPEVHFLSSSSVLLVVMTGIFVGVAGSAAALRALTVEKE